MSVTTLYCVAYHPQHVNYSKDQLVPSFPTAAQPRLKNLKQFLQSLKNFRSICKVAYTGLPPTGGNWQKSRTAMTVTPANGSQFSNPNV